MVKLVIREEVTESFSFSLIITPQMPDMFASLCEINGKQARKE